MWINKTLLIFIIFSGCYKEKNQLISNTPANLPEIQYKMNLNSNSGELIDTVTITWNAIGNVVTIKKLLDQSSVIEVDDTQNSYSFVNIEPNLFFDIEVSGVKNDSTYKDTIQIYSRLIHPVKDFKYEIEEVMRGNGEYDDYESFIDSNGDGQWSQGEDFIDSSTVIQYHRKLSWIPSNESDDIFINYKLFRSNDPQQLIDINNCNNCELTIDTLSRLDSIYIDSTNFVITESGLAAYYYMIQVVAADYTRNSFIFNFTGFNQISSLELNNVTSNKENYIDINWDTISDATYFYQYEIYRSSDNGENDVILIAEIPNNLINHFQDRNSGNGITWYYAIAVIDINGRKSIGNYFPGWTLP